MRQSQQQSCPRFGFMIELAEQLGSRIQEWNLLFLGTKCSVFCLHTSWTFAVTSMDVKMAQQNRDCLIRDLSFKAIVGRAGLWRMASLLTFSVILNMLCGIAFRNVISNFLGSNDYSSYLNTMKVCSKYASESWWVATCTDAYSSFTLRRRHYNVNVQLQISTKPNMIWTFWIHIHHVIVY